MDAYTDLLKNRINAYEEENKILWNAVKEIANLSQSQEESKKIAQAAFDELCPFLPLMTVQATKESEEVAA